ncbi:hypothetical protein ACS33_16435 [Edwardsiella ictaluri]|nr:hypothetical protein ABY58_16395 [Edwardsiella ictaluri]KOO54040.1 hypothetical protein ACS33_16435 [Edwardsiella ictaluri]
MTLGLRINSLRLNKIKLSRYAHTDIKDNSGRDIHIDINEIIISMRVIILFELYHQQQVISTQALMN